VLEVGSGTGRILIPIARAGISIVGLDRSHGMLQRCLEKIAQEPPEVRDRIEVRRADMRTFDLGRQFALIIVPFRGFQHLIDADDQRAFLRAARRHLAPGGRLVFDVFNPDPARLASPSTEESEDTPLTPLRGGRAFRRTARVVAIDQTAHVSHVELTYYVRNATGGEDRRVQAFPMRWFFPEEIPPLVESAGLSVRSIFGDLQRSPVSPGSPDLIVVAEHPS
jgi:SAM-dependent methyltransferase